ncbi:MAG: glycosyltransferase [Erysipelotrichaceae bacterium]|nr:glycosyltransferase [Erysipelotrichaceae bacterium]
MKVLLYFEAEKLISTSGIGRALKHQMAACASSGIETTTDPEEKVDLVHINTLGPGSLNVIAKARKEGIPIIYHAHSTEEDFRNSFVFSNTVAPAFKQHLIKMYSMADYILTPTPYSKKLLEGYGITVPIEDISNGIDLNRFEYNAEKVKAYRKYFSLNKDDKVVLSVGLYFERKGILDFIEVAKRLPDYKFIWFGYTPLYSIPKQIREIIDEHPRNVYFPGYVKGPIIEGAYSDANCFFFASHEETEGIVVLEALASRQNIVIRDIGVFEPWLKHGRNCYKGNNVDEFVELVRGVVEKKLPDVSDEGRKTAEKRSIEHVGKQLKCIYEKVIELNSSSVE